MRGIIGLGLLLVGASMAWLIILGKFPPKQAGMGLLGYFQQYQTNSTTSQQGGSK